MTGTAAVSEATRVALRAALDRCMAMDAPLAERLDAYAAASRRLIPAFTPAIEALIARLQAHRVGASAPRPGEMMPPFCLEDETGRLVTLESLLATAPVAVVFHRGHWCPYCRITARELARIHPEVAARGGQLVAIMPEGRAHTAALKAQAGADYPFLSDLDNGYALSVNLVFWMGEDLRSLYLELGTDIGHFQRNRSWTLPLPATFVVDRAGVIRARFVEPDFRKRVQTADLLDAVAQAAS